MSTLKKLTGTVTPNYLPAVLKENKSGWLIEYYAENPVDKELQRKQIRLQTILKRYKSIREARLHINRIIFNINAKLAGGWNPFFRSEDARLYEKLIHVTKLFLKEKSKENRDATMRSYTSFVTLITGWAESNCPDSLASMFNRLMAVKYLDYMYNERNVSSITYNNHLKMGKAMFNWMVEKCYCKENPFNQIKPKPKTQKKRIIIPPDTRKRIIDYLQHNRPFLLLCKLIFTSLIRPGEIKLLKISSINLDKKYIYISPEISKNKKERFSALTPDIINDMKALNFDKIPGEHYMFGLKLEPSDTRAGNGYYNEVWVKTRRELNLPKEMQLYSLRDTGIFEMLKSGIDDLSVMQHANHHSLDITTIYANHADKNLIDKISDNAPDF